MKHYINDPYLYERRLARRAAFSTTRLALEYLGPLVWDEAKQVWWYGTARSDYP